MNNLKRILTKNEYDLLTDKVRTSSELLNEYLDRDFVEHGKSGKIWNKKQIISALKKSMPCEMNKYIKINNIKVRLLSKTVALFTSQYHDKRTKTKVNRVSIYKLYNMKWKMTFHQGTISI